MFRDYVMLVSGMAYNSSWYHIIPLDLPLFQWDAISACRVCWQIFQSLILCRWIDWWAKKPATPQYPGGKTNPFWPWRSFFQRFVGNHGSSASIEAGYPQKVKRRHTTTDIEGHTYLHIWELCHPGKLTHGSSKEYWIQLQKTEAAIEFKKNDTTVQIISLVSSRLLLLAKFHNRRFLEGLGSTWLIVTLHAYLVEITASTNL